MRAPFQILAIPYRIVDGTPMYCVFHRADHDQWQFIAGGGEDNETPLAAAKRETFEEGGVHSTQWLGLKSLSYIPVTIISEMSRKHWDSSTYVIPEYTFGFECQDDVRLSPEHTDCVWLTYDEANQKLKWDSNRTALYELNCRLKKRMKRRLDEVNPKENDNEIIELTDEELDEIFADDDFDNGEDGGEIRSFYFSNPDPYAKVEPRPDDAPKREFSFDDKGNIVVKIRPPFGCPTSKSWTSMAAQNTR